MSKSNKQFDNPFEPDELTEQQQCRAEAIREDAKSAIELAKQLLRGIEEECRISHEEFIEDGGGDRYRLCYIRTKCLRELLQLIVHAEDETRELLGEPPF